MGAGAVLEPLVVIVLLFGGTWINRTMGRTWGSGSTDFDSGSSTPTTSIKDSLLLDGRPASPRSPRSSRSPSPRLLEGRWRQRQIGLFNSTFTVTTPDTAVYQDRLLSRLLQKFPFLVECWYWALVYWTYQLGRAFTAVTLQEGTVDVARQHALQLIRFEKAIRLFWEVPIQQAFLQHPGVMKWVNWTYSFIHIPGTIAFLVGLYYYTTTRNRCDESQPEVPRRVIGGTPAGPHLYQARRRTLAMCNLLAFVVFTLWPCMPPRLLSDPNVEGPEGELGRSYGFVDTVHGANGTGSVWTQNRFCNQYAAMPSLHFGYSLMIGLTVMVIPLPSHHRQPIGRSRWCIRSLGIPMPSWRRLACLMVGFTYPLMILLAIVATANHFIVDAVAGALVCVLGWRFNYLLLNLLPLEDYFLWLVRIHKPEPTTVDAMGELDGWIDDDDELGGQVLPR
ncbi:hypothetical protein P168DRAFT_230807 [Aspergillus campestris IBT 28561]|uniref:Inositolphosphotransferase Aur1/Ipt1 domain-containing protein n=1 Tax=Aspergillus campestris (strain IBT 28561) TaxID=1392248 RepID=A0A2I1DAW5_ASPC2|nr:uncharacterized protein P168DRAFT_230807 [Aspergillus campestris IBT 28561]PKY07009.1 hypothetical protein P168DRAFT_230807 [Aspergillus campestris IBT 28561]